MIFNIAICDDEKKDIDIISKYLSDYQMKYNIDFKISRFSSGAALLYTYSKHGVFQLLFIDVEMPVLSGLEVAKKIRKLPDRDVKIIFISNYPEYMQNSFNVQAFQYLSKPLSYEHFMNVMDNVIEDFNLSHTVQCIVKTNLSEEIIYSNKIIYVHTIDAYSKRLEIVLEDHIVETTGTISDWEKSLRWLNFVIPHRGYLINSSQIHYFENKKLIMNNGDQIPISRRKEKEIRNIFAEKAISIRRI